MVREPKHRDPSYPLKEFDILTRIGTHEIDNEGMIQAEDNLPTFVHVAGPEARPQWDGAGDRAACRQDDRGGPAGQSRA